MLPQIKIVYNRFKSALEYESTTTDIYSTKALQASPSYAAYEVEGDELAADMSSFAMANAIYAALVEGHAAEVSARRNAMCASSLPRIGTVLTVCVM